MNFGIINLIQIIGSLAFFIYGMKMMSDGLQRAAGNQLRNILRTMTQNRFLGVFTGFVVTSIIQSSSATTVMTVGFVNAGILTLTESAGVMMGANIGTTITGWIVAILGFEVELGDYSIPFFAVGVPLLLAGKGKLKYWGEFIIGFAILFMGLSYLKDSVPAIEENPQILEFLSYFTEWGFLSYVFFVFIGAILTIVIQSSSASMAMTLVMCTQGWLPLDIAAAMILGENIGTTTTAELASLVGNTAAKRSARVHSLFNILGVTWMIIALPFILPVLGNICQYFFGIGDPFTTPHAMPLTLAAFHTSFNTLNAMIMLPLMPWLIRLATITVKEKSEEASSVKLKFINNPAITPELNIDAIQKETAHFGEIVGRLNGFLHTAINSIEIKDKEIALKKISKYEQITDMMEIEITEYITNLADKELTHETSTRLRSYANIANDLERIGDIYFQMAKTLEQKNEDKIYFLPEQRNGLNQLMEAIENAFKQMNANLSVADYAVVTKDSAIQLEQKINAIRDELRSKNLRRLGEEDYKVKGAMIYNNIFSSLERVGDHIINVTESVVGEI